VNFLVLRCDDAGCFVATLLDSGDLGPIKKGKIAALRLQWDPENDQFIFQRDDEPEIFSQYAVSDTASPGAPFKRLQVIHFVENCTTEPRPVAFMEAFFDDVFVNESAGPYPYGPYGASLMGPVRPLFAWTSLALVAGLVVSQLAGRRKRRESSGFRPEKLA
jgi:hypothetical protein